MKRIALIILAVTLTGCATVPEIVEIPVPVPCPPPPAVARPLLAIRSITPDTPPAEVERAYLASLKQLGGYATELETLLNGYRERNNAR